MVVFLPKKQLAVLLDDHCRPLPTGISLGVTDLCLSRCMVWTMSSTQCICRSRFLFRIFGLRCTWQHRSFSACCHKGSVDVHWGVLLCALIPAPAPPWLALAPSVPMLPVPVKNQIQPRNHTPKQNQNIIYYSGYTDFSLIPLSKFHLIDAIGCHTLQSSDCSSSCD